MTDGPTHYQLADATLALVACTALGAGDYEAWVQAIRGEVAR